MQPLLAPIVPRLSKTFELVLMEMGVLGNTLLEFFECSPKGLETACFDIVEKLAVIDSQLLVPEPSSTKILEILPKFHYEI